MKLLVVAVGQRQPAWADAAWADLAKRFPPETRLELKALKVESRSGGKTPSQCMAAEAARFELAIPKTARRVVLDEHGARLTTAALAERLQAWRQGGRDVDPVHQSAAEKIAELVGVVRQHELGHHDF